MADLARAEENEERLKKDETVEAMRSSRAKMTLRSTSGNPTSPAATKRDRAHNPGRWPTRPAEPKSRADQFHNKARRADDGGPQLCVPPAIRRGEAPQARQRREKCAVFPSCCLLERTGAGAAGKAVGAQADERQFMPLDAIARRRVPVDAFRTAVDNGHAVATTA